MNKKNNWKIELSEYLKIQEPSKIQKTKMWGTAIGLQEVDGLTPSAYLIDTAKQHIEGDIDLNEVHNRIDSYYKSVDERKKDFTNNCEEADKVAVRITQLLSDCSFSFNYSELIRIHRKLFDDIFPHAGKIRTYNFTKEEWVLNGDTVTYASYENIIPSLEYDFKEMKEFKYKEVSFEQFIDQLCKFTSNIWQVHPFSEGNTRTTAVFIIKYLRTFGFNVNNDIFASNSWYFRNSLVRANYTNYNKQIFEDDIYLKKFFYNLLSDSNYELKNRYLHINYVETDNLSESLPNINCSLDELNIINVIRDNPYITQKQISLLVNKSLRTVNTLMVQMQSKHIIRRVKGKKNGYWEIM